MWIDSHTHLQDPLFDQDLASVLARAREAGVSRYVLSGVDPEDWAFQDQLVLRAQGWGLPPSTWVKSNGIHPWKVQSTTALEVDVALEILSDKLSGSNGDIKAVGEIGVDCSPKHGAKSNEDLKMQILIFKKQMELARQFNLPVILHVVKAHGAILEYLKDSKWVKPKGSAGIVHSFSGSISVAKAYAQFGFLISIGTSVLRPGYENLKKLAKEWPVEDLVLETDCPSLSIDQARIGEPMDLLAVAEGVASLRGKESAKEILAFSTQNALRVFRL